MASTPTRRLRPWPSRNILGCYLHCLLSSPASRNPHLSGPAQTPPDLGSLPWTPVLSPAPGLGPRVARPSGLPSSGCCGRLAWSRVPGRAPGGAAAAAVLWVPGPELWTGDSLRETPVLCRQSFSSTTRPSTRPRGRTRTWWTPWGSECALLPSLTPRAGGRDPPRARACCLPGRPSPGAGTCWEGQGLGAPAACGASCPLPDASQV